MDFENIEQFKEYMGKNFEAIEAVRENVIIFLKQECLLNTDQGIFNKELYHAYELWCAKNTFRKLSNMEFVKYLRKLGAISKHKKNGGYWLGLTLKQYQV